MKLFWMGLFACFMVSGCGKSEKDQLAEELIPVLGRAADEMIQQAELTFTSCNQAQEKNNFKQTGFMKDAGLLDAQVAHQIANRFFNYSNTFRAEHRYRDTYPFEEINSRFQASFDSLTQLIEFMPEKKYPAFNYSQSKHKSNLALTTIRMEYDIATLEVDVLNTLQVAYWVTIIRDDFHQAETDK